MSDDSGTAKTYSSTFPRELPADLDDPRAVAENDQLAYHGLGQMLRHWDRPYRTSYRWLVQVGDSLDAVDLAVRCQRSLPGEGLDPIPGPWIHLTVKRAGYEDEMSERELDQAVEDAERRVSRLPRFSLGLIPLAGSPGAVRLSVAPWTPLMALFDAVSDQGTAKAVFRPHVGIAYSNAQQHPGVIAEAVRQAASELAPIDVPVTSLSLVKMWRAAAWYEWQELAVVPLA